MGRITPTYSTRGGWFVQAQGELEFGVNAAQSLTDNYANSGVLDAGLSETRTSLGGFANGRIYGPPVPASTARAETSVSTHLQAFGAIQYTLFDSFYIKMVVAYADAHYDMLSDDAAMRQNYHNESLSGRLRLMYLF